MSEEKVLAEKLDEAFRTAWRRTAQVMYEAYGHSVDWKSVTGHQMPKFENLGPRIEGAWCVAAAASHGTYLVEENTMDKHGDNTPTFQPNDRVKVAGQAGHVVKTLDDGRVMIEFDDGKMQPIEPDKVERS